MTGNSMALDLTLERAHPEGARLAKHFWRAASHRKAKRERALAILEAVAALMNADITHYTECRCTMFIFRHDLPFFHVMCGDPDVRKPDVALHPGCCWVHKEAVDG